MIYVTSAINIHFNVTSHCLFVIDTVTQYSAETCTSMDTPHLDVGNTCNNNENIACKAQEFNLCSTNSNILYLEYTEYA